MEQHAHFALLSKLSSQLLPLLPLNALIALLTGWRKQQSSVSIAPMWPTTWTELRQLMAAIAGLASFGTQTQLVANATTLMD